MTSAPQQPPLHFPILVISDAHLGMRGVRAGLLLEFLTHVTCDTLIINGDFIDGYRLATQRGRKFPETHARVLDLLNRRIAEGMKVYYVPGNHDSALRKTMVGKSFMGIQFADPYVFDDARGRRIVAVHGDSFCHANSKMLKKAFIRIYDVAASTNLLASHIANRLTGKFSSPLSQLRQRSEPFLNLTEKFRAAATDYMREHKAQGVFGAHLHLPALEETAEGLYGNSGDWVDTGTALAMTPEGDWRLLNWPALRAGLGFGQVPDWRAPNPNAAFRPETQRLLAMFRGLWPDSRGKGPRTAPTV